MDSIWIDFVNIERTILAVKSQMRAQFEAVYVSVIMLKNQLLK